MRRTAKHTQVDSHGKTGNVHLPDYREYRFSPVEWLILIALYFSACGLIGWLFYGHVAAGAVFFPGICLFARYEKKKKAEERRRQLSLDFRTALGSLSVSLKAGYSVENAIKAAAADLRAACGPDSDLSKEFLYMSRQLRYGKQAEEMLEDFAVRSGIEDIRNFSAVFTAAKRTGGNMAAMIAGAAATIGSRLEVEAEIQTVLASKKLEQKIMTAMPAGILLYMRLGSPGFLDGMYGTVIGVIMMTAALAIYVAAAVWGIKITDIRV